MASILVLLDLSTAFDTVDHQLLLSDFSDCGVEGTALSLLESYLKNREQYVAIGESRSEPTALQYGVPQGSVLGPVLLTVYTGSLVHLLFFWKLMELVTTFLQMTRSCTSRLKILMKPNIGFHLSCHDLKIWMARRKLKLNDGKTEIIVIRGNLRNVPVANFGLMSFGDTQLVPCESAKNLSVVLDSSLSFRSHTDSIVKTCSFHICNLYMINP